MSRYIDGSLPQAVMDESATSDWDPETNTIGRGDPGETIDLLRYEHWMDNVTVARAFDEHHRDHPTAIARKFGLEREIPEEEVERLLVDGVVVHDVLDDRLADAMVDVPHATHHLGHVDRLVLEICDDMVARLALLAREAACARARKAS